jgi:nitroimidazol reductase NimA-like FMN-containing flavoprotein (pyridoxamine 5'-phosphate oxidase superfamily)
MEIKGAWPQDEIYRFLDSSRYPLRLACVGGDGFPRVVSLWYHCAEGKLLCVTHKSAQLAALLDGRDKVGFEVAPNEPPYHGVRGQGTAEMQPLGENSTLEDLLDRYLGRRDSALAQWLLSRSRDELLITITPLRLFSWDYRQRMADAVGD